jgi:hypothetical protein
VSATGDDPAELARRLEQLRERAAVVRFYSVGLRHAVWEYPAAPTVVSVPVRLEFPWNRGEASAVEHAEAFGEALAGCLENALREEDGTTERQVEWYGRHRRLNGAVWDIGDAPGGISPSSGALASAPASA